MYVHMAAVTVGHTVYRRQNRLYDGTMQLQSGGDSHRSAAAPAGSVTWATRRRCRPAFARQGQAGCVRLL